MMLWFSICGGSLVRIVITMLAGAITVFSLLEYPGAGALPVDSGLLPNDPEFFRQWSLEQINDVDMDIVTAWGMMREMDESLLSSVTVAVMDGSIDLDGPEFEGRTVPGCDIVEAYNRLLSVEQITLDECKPPKLESNAHGNGAAGIIAAKYNNSHSITGVAGPYEVSLMPLKGYVAKYLWCANPPDAELNDQYFAASVRFAADNGARVFCTSVGYLPTEVDIDIMREALQYANDNGMLVVVAAGNVNPCFSNNPLNPNVLPGSFDEPNVISVGSINLAGHLAVDWDGSGEEYQDHTYYGQHVDIVAPGVAITTTDRHFFTDFINNAFSPYGTAGSRWAAPFVAGVASLALTAFPDLSVDQLKQALMNGVQRTDELMNNEVCFCRNEPSIEQPCTHSTTTTCGVNDELMTTRLVQSGGYIRAPLVLEEAARLLGKTITLGGRPFGSYPKAAFSVTIEGVDPAHQPEDHIRNWNGIEIGDGDSIEFSAFPLNTNYEYEWVFGDESTNVVGAISSHVYSSPGVYKAKLIVTDTTTSLMDEAPPLKVTVYPQGSDHVIIIRNTNNNEADGETIVDTYFVQSSFNIRTSWFGDHRVEGSGYFEVDGVDYWLTLETQYPAFGASYKYFKLEHNNDGDGGDESITSKWAWTIGGIQHEDYGENTEMITVDIPPYQFVVTVTD